MIRDEYVRRFRVERVIDGDTVAGSVDLGFNIYTRTSVRLAGINARELRDPGGAEARDHLTRLLPADLVLTIRSVKADKYANRVDAIVVMPDGSNLNERLVREGWAAPYTGTGLTSDHVPPWPRPTPEQ